jgi:diphosphomevalonate decarboxylase
MIKKAWATAHPSLALMKYWGKLDSGKNLPATPSLAVTLTGLRSEVVVEASDEDRVVLAGEELPIEHFKGFFENIRQELDLSINFSVHSKNNFPTAAGLASSSSGFAAMAAACYALTEKTFSTEKLSSLARQGSGSASRAIYGGFTLFPAGSPVAQPLYNARHWPDLRILLCLVEEGPKPVSSRTAMEKTRTTSPFFNAWVSDSKKLINGATQAVGTKDLEKLGHFMRLSYQRMFATMFSADPPIIYWKPRSLELIHLAEELRRKGVGVWETMDAGPQVKLFCDKKDLKKLKKALDGRFKGMTILEASIGEGVQFGPGDAIP